MKPCVRACFDTDTRTRGGSRETEEKELAVMPWMPPSQCVVTTVIPLGQWLRTLLNWSLVTGNAVALAGYEMRDARCAIGDGPSVMADGGGDVRETPAYRVFRIAYPESRITTLL